MKYDSIAEAYVSMLVQPLHEANASQKLADRTPDIESLLQSNKVHEKEAAFYHKDLNDGHIKRLLAEPSMALRTNVFHPTRSFITPEHIDLGLKDSAYQVRLAAIRHPNANAKNISTALNDEDERVRRSALHGDSVNNEHIERGLSDKHLSVRQAAVYHPNANSENIVRALRDPHASVRLEAILHPNSDGSHVEIAIKDQNVNVANAAVSHPAATKDQMLRAMNVKRLGSMTNKLTAFNKHPKFNQYFPTGRIE